MALTLHDPEQPSAPAAPSPSKHPHRGMKGIADLLANPERIAEIAAHGKTRAKMLGVRGITTLSVVEIYAMAVMLDFYLEDHPLAVPGPQPCRAPAPKGAL